MLCGVESGGDKGVCVCVFTCVSVVCLCLCVRSMGVRACLCSTNV